MTKEERVKYWIDIAEYDFDTAKVMLKSGRRLYVAFMCHQVVEKNAQSILVCNTGERASIHS